MKAIVHDFHTQVFPSTEDVRDLCKIWEGKETCIFLVMDSNNGWECHALNRMPIMSLIERSERGETHAQRQGCDRVLKWDIPGMGEQEIV